MSAVGGVYLHSVSLRSGSHKRVAVDISTVQCTPAQGHRPPVTCAGRKPFANATDVCLSTKHPLYEDVRELTLLSIYRKEILIQ